MTWPYAAAPISETAAPSGAVVEPGERARHFLRIAEEAFATGKHEKAHAAAALASAYLEAAEQDRYERAEREARESAEHVAGVLRKLSTSAFVPLEGPDAAS